MGENTMEEHALNPTAQGTLPTGNTGNEKYNIKQDDPQQCWFRIQWSKDASGRR